MAEPVRVLIVDDSPFMRRAVERMLSEDAAIEVVATAVNGEDALEQVKLTRPDVVILDVNMPHVDGLEALRRIMTEAPTNVLMLSTLTREGADTTLKALDLGAIDFLDKTAAGTAMDIYGIAPQLREKVLAVAGATWPAPAAEVPPQPVPRPPLGPGGAYDAVLIGASTGGPRALTDLLCHLPGDFPAGVVIAQHMPAGFTLTLAERLDRRCGQRVIEAADGAYVAPGAVLIAPGGQQITLERRDGVLVVRVEPGPPDLLHRPCVDLLFESAARVLGARGIGVVLTGMGDDGARGLRAMKEAGAATIAESAATAVIYGMPRVSAEWADRVLPLGKIGPNLVRLAVEGRWADEGGA